MDLHGFEAMFEINRSVAAEDRPKVAVECEAGHLRAVADLVCGSRFRKACQGVLAVQCRRKKHMPVVDAGVEDADGHRFRIRSIQPIYGELRILGLLVRLEVDVGGRALFRETQFGEHIEQNP